MAYSYHQRRGFCPFRISQASLGLCLFFVSFSRMSHRPSDTRQSSLQNQDSTWTTARRVRVLDWKASPIPCQVHQVLVPSSSTSGWTTELFLHALVEVPALGFVTIFVSAASNAERIDSAASGEVKSLFCLCFSRFSCAPN